MKAKWLFIGAVVSLVLMSGCTRKFHLARNMSVEESKWPFVRKDLEATGWIQSGFKGQLNLKWEKKISERPMGPPTIGAGEIIYSGSKGKIYFIDPKTGKSRGRYKNSTNIETGVIAVDSLAYFAVALRPFKFYALNLHNQKVVWTAALKEVAGAPIIIESRIYIASDTGTVNCLDRLSGKRIWSATASSRSLAGVSFGDNIIYVPCDNGVMEGFDAMSGEVIFKSDLQQPLVSKAAVADKVYLSGAGGGFFALEKKTGAVTWKREFSWPIWTSPAVDNEKVYVGDNGGILHALDKVDGHTIWEFKTKGVIVASPIVVGDYVICASLDRSIYCIDKDSGLMVSKRALKHEVRFGAISDGERIYVAAHDGTIQCFGD